MVFITFVCFFGTVITVAVRSTALGVAGSITVRKKYLCGLLVVPGLAVCVCDFSTLVNALTIQEVFLVWGQRYLKTG